MFDCVSQGLGELGALMQRHVDLTSKNGSDPWEALTGFRLNKPAKAIAWIELDGAPALARVMRGEARADVEIDPNASAAGRRAGDAPRNGAVFSFTAAPAEDGFRISVDGGDYCASVVDHARGKRVFIGADHWDIPFPDPLTGALGGHSAEGSLNAPMPGLVTLLKANPGDRLEAGAVLMVMEAMKMEHAIKAPHDGILRAFNFKPGDQVKEGDLLAEFREAD